MIYIGRDSTFICRGCGEELIELSNKQIAEREIEKKEAEKLNKISESRQDDMERYR
jgi:hypothetical protein